MASDVLSPPGSSQYHSNTMTVGDGTWDSSRNTFLLPNLMGLNFATMRYNGMGNRFRELNEYHSLIIGHGVVAAIVFLLIVPAAVFFAKYYHGDRQLALKAHVNLQICTVFLTTVVVILGFIAVGPARALTNPHHGIGLAIYVCILAQFIYGWWAHKREKKRKELPIKEPLKFWLHKLFGRAIAILGVVQIALGLTLYGSPEYLFILYALVAALLLFLYLALDYRYKTTRHGVAGEPEFYSDYGSYYSGGQTDLSQSQPPGQRSHWLRNTALLGGAFAAYEGFKHRRERKRQDRVAAAQQHTDGPIDNHYSSAGPAGQHPPGPTARPQHRPPPGSHYPPDPNHPPGSHYPPGPNYPPVTPTRRAHSRHDETRPSPDSWEDEKDSYAPQQHTWRDRILGAGAGIAAVEGVRRLVSRRRGREDSYAQDNRYHRPGGESALTQTDISRVEEGQAPMSPNDPRRTNAAGATPMTPTGPTPHGTAFTPGQDAGVGVGANNRVGHSMTETPSRVPRRPRPRQSMDSFDEDSQPGFANSPHSVDDDGPLTLRDSMRVFGPMAGFRAWTRQRKDRRETDRQDQLRRQEMDAEERFKQQQSGNYPTAADMARPSHSETLMTGLSPSQAPGMRIDMHGSNPELNRTAFGARPDTNAPPLPVAAGQIPTTTRPDTLGPGPRPGPSNTLNVSRQQLLEQGYHVPPPPPGPPPGNNGLVSSQRPPEAGTLSMPVGAVQPDPSRLYSRDDAAPQQPSTDHPLRDTAAAGMAGAAVAHAASERKDDGQSPTRYHHSREGSRTRFRDPVVSGSQGTGTGSGEMASPTFSMKLEQHGDGGHITLRKLNEQEAAAERSARRAERRARRQRRNSSFSSGLESDGGGGGITQGRFRRGNRAEPAPMRPSSMQPITNVPPPPPAMSSTAGSGPAKRRDSELNLPPPAAAQTSTATITPPRQPGGAADTPAGSVGSPPPMGYSSAGEVGTGTDLSNLAADNRKRRRAERARRAQQQYGKMEF